jgi:hypothetical protein
MQSRMWRSLFVFLSICCLIWSQAETGQIVGTVQDPTGAVIPNATVRVQNTGTGAERTVQTSSSGDYAVTNLLPGGWKR